MKVLYSAFTDPSSNGQLLGFTRSKEHEIRCSAHLDHSFGVNSVDWNLDAIYTTKKTKNKPLAEIFGTAKIKDIPAEIFYEDVKQWQPDIIISEGEVLASNLARSLDIPLVHLSPLLIVNSSLGYSRATVRRFSELPEPIMSFVNSPFSLIDLGIELEDSFDWACPYYKENSWYSSPKKEEFFCSISNILGSSSLTFCDTASLCSALISGNIMLSPDDNDECRLHYRLMQEFRLANIDLGFFYNNRQEFLDRILNPKPVEEIHFKYNDVCHLDEVIGDL